jgi:isopentenyl-diphosphate delta-isomerase
MEDAIQRKLMQEMHIDAQPVFAYKFIYKTDLENGLTENELDHVFIGTYDGEPEINRDEVEDWKFISLPDLQKLIKENPEQFTFWFKLITSDPEFKAITASIV